MSCNVGIILESVCDVKLDSVWQRGVEAYFAKKFYGTVHGNMKCQAGEYNSRK